MAISYSPKKIFQMPNFPGKSLKIPEKEWFSANLRLRNLKFEPEKNEIPHPQPFHAPTGLPPITGFHECLHGPFFLSGIPWKALFQPIKKRPIERLLRTAVALKIVDSCFTIAEMCVLQYSYRFAAIFPRKDQHLQSGTFQGGVTEGGGFHTPVRGTMFVRDGAVTPGGPSRECAITFFVKGRPKSARQSRDGTVAARRVQSVTVPSSRLSRECPSPGLRSPPLKKCSRFRPFALGVFSMGVLLPHVGPA